MSNELLTPQETSINIGTINNLVNVSEVHLNVSQKLIVTTEDKVNLCLTKHIKLMEKRKGWIAPLGILITIIVTLSTTNFNNILWLEASTWKAIFIISGFLSTGWLVFAIREALKSEKVEDIITELKKDSKALKSIDAAQ